MLLGQQKEAGQRRQGEPCQGKGVSDCLLLWSPQLGRSERPGNQAGVYTRRNRKKQTDDVPGDVYFSVAAVFALASLDVLVAFFTRMADVSLVDVNLVSRGGVGTATAVFFVDANLFVVAFVLARSGEGVLVLVSLFVTFPSDARSLRR